MRETHIEVRVLCAVACFWYTHVPITEGSPAVFNFRLGGGGEGG